MAQRVPTAKLSSCDTPERTEEVKNGMQPFESHAILICMVYLFYAYFASSKTTLTDYQCVSTGCCTHVAKKTKITIDNQHVTKSLQSDRFLPE